MSHFWGKFDIILGLAQALLDPRVSPPKSILSVNLDGAPEVAAHHIPKKICLNLENFKKLSLRN
jgi:hypothetical protein